jgi:hypothetical protein
MGAGEHSSRSEELIEGDVSLLGVRNGLGGGDHRVSIIAG